MNIYKKVDYWVIDKYDKIYDAENKMVISEYIKKSDFYLDRIILQYD